MERKEDLKARKGWETAWVMAIVQRDWKLDGELAIALIVPTTAVFTDTCPVWRRR